MYRYFIYILNINHKPNILGNYRKENIIICPQIVGDKVQTRKKHEQLFLHVDISGKLKRIKFVQTKLKWAKTSIHCYTIVGYTLIFNACIIFPSDVLNWTSILLRKSTQQVCEGGHVTFLAGRALQQQFLCGAHASISFLRTRRSTLTNYNATEGLGDTKKT